MFVESIMLHPVLGKGRNGKGRAGEVGDGEGHPAAGGGGRPDLRVWAI